MPAISPDELQRLIGEAVTAAIERVTCFFNEKLAIVNRRLEEQDLELNITKERLKKIEVAVNHQEQYSRRTHIRIKGLEVRSGQTCKEEVVKFINNNLSLKDARGTVTTVSVTDIDAAHPLPVRQSDSKTPLKPLIVRFFTRDVRDLVIRARRQLKNKGITIHEDLTAANARLLRSLQESDDFEAAWTWGGKVYAKHKDGARPVRHDI
ncbi:hypothetical protein CAPTEDRAFT_218484 [Capitella teleta]|uniref:Uncharacterized protein n=1 Tax=Capitella teleta TaxID=283909 RepID=R7VM21_CAPTE|nr:hypothetical protein CAPTEDRAFT_218484 [Capitella teleta]|eukprot:ELU18756.1 hypothetical protein CAPTEDRAFT_218484 [Capitella teleta]